MKNRGTISALLFLCMYTIIMLHNVLPHAHADHAHDEPSEPVALAQHHHADHHHHGHHHHHAHNHSPTKPSQQNAEDAAPGLLDLLLGLIGGADHHDTENEDFSCFVGEQVILQTGTASATLSPAFLTERLPFFVRENAQWAYQSYRPPIRSQQDSRRTLPLRGPPRVLAA